MLAALRCIRKAPWSHAAVLDLQVRTMSEKEKDCGYRNCVAFDDPTNQVVLQAPANHNFHRHHGKPFHGFAFDHFYGPKESSEDIYRDCVAKLVENATRVSSLFPWWLFSTSSFLLKPHAPPCLPLQGFNACVLAYGQTGSGKTYTMTGGTGNCGMKDKGQVDA